MGAFLDQKSDRESPPGKMADSRGNYPIVRSRFTSNNIELQNRVRVLRVSPMSSAAADERVRQFVAGMPSEERMLVVLKRELYEGSWDEMTADLKARLEHRPYIFKLANRITDDLERIERLREFERRNRVDLSDYVPLEP